MTNTDPGALRRNQECGQTAVKKPLILAVVGPTGIGKSETAIHLAKALGNVEIISMDSMQVYRGLDIGTAKLHASEMEGIPHHLLDIADPKTIYTVSDYKRDAAETIDGILSRSHVPMLVGGTGFYLDALSYELTMGDEGADPELRAALHAQAETEEGRLELFKRLQSIDPDSASKLHPNDVHRVVRAIEIYETTGQRKSEQTRSEGPYHILVYGLSMDRERLYSHLNARVHRMIAAGWQQEVENLMSAGIRFDRTDGGVSQAIGYPELAEVSSGTINMEFARERIQRNTRRYAKRQWTWFRRDPRIIWFERENYTGQEALEKAMLDQIRSDINRMK
ncbi:MAG: tRNA (adenosine(37)-N6)-dimethylallyltransferase MiaA [Clostridia bacterium]|nr:tRNA (adenosine(37)-N6)-dimethylallyltransferase MiaA [Clostridia bacterium]